jgi:GNAT superfamily N-acetyltransferase
MPIMDRPADPIEVFEADGTVIGRVGDADDLAEAERVIVDGFPQRMHQPWTRGRSLPPRLLEVPGWTAWLARRDGEPAAAGFTYDDGKAVGVYWLATLPEHRSRGLARAIMTRALAAHPARTATLVATEAGEPLYHSLGFVTVSTSAWYMLSRTG